MDHGGAGFGFGGGAVRLCRETGAFEQKDGNGDPSYSIRLPLTEDNTGICVSSTHDGTAIAMADLERGRIEFIRVDHNTGEVTRWTTENVPFSDIYDLPTEGK